MTDLAAASLPAWGNFYVIVGSSAAALIGIQFIVLTLVATMRTPSSAAIHAFATPQVVHLAGALVVSAVMCMPWPSLVPAAIAVGASGFAGIAYGTIVIKRARSQDAYAPVWEDWLWHALLPCGSYVALALTSLILCTSPLLAEYVAAGAALALLLIGIHNAWDAVTHQISITASKNNPAKESSVEIKRSGSQPSGAGPGDWFTGAVRIDPLFQAPDPARAVGASVTFEPGARTAWHTHPLGQTLIVTAGRGLAQRWGGPLEEIRPGDVVWFPPGEKHWHGAAQTTAMTHIAIQERLDGKAVEWMEKVTDEQYMAE